MNLSPIERKMVFVSYTHRIRALESETMRLLQATSKPQKPQRKQQQQQLEMERGQPIKSKSSKLKRTKCKQSIKVAHFVKVVFEQERYFEPEVLVLSAALIDRFILGMKTFAEIDFFKLSMATIFVAQKYLEDTGAWHLKDFTKISNLGPKELLGLEQELLETINYSLFMTPS